MDRRQFIRKAGLVSTGAAASVGTLAMPAIAQSLPEIKWRLASSFPKSTDALFGSSELFAKTVSEATDGKFEIRPFAGGEIVPPAQNMEAVGNGTIEGHSLAARRHPRPDRYRLVGRHGHPHGGRPRRASLGPAGLRAAA